MSVLPVKTVAVTGAHGKAGRAAVAEFLAHGYQVLACDLAGPVGRNSDLGTPTMRVDLTDYGQALQALTGADAVVHLANIPEPGMFPPAETLNRNTAMNHNVFLAAQALGLARVVWASSETTLGLPFAGDGGTLRYAPVDEAHFPHPSSTYALSKVLGEAAAAQFAAWSGIPFVGLRLTNIFSADEYAQVPGFWADPLSRAWNLWGYVDARDVGAACRNAVEAASTGSENLIIAAADTVMDRPSAELLDEFFPGLERRRDVSGHETLLAIDAARRVIGYAPAHSWRDNQ
ncbi:MULTISPECIES: NAD(P)-dependent oxidoreductase [unclassified Arthrobacter]|uniref:NAD-dependent epimerase/dehydratase family protein n=1 Tax=unclassified Arthrobacter TaxID=235627 RepID=UPI00159D088A|nr:MULTISPECIES: NAD(P)-dependent oxidoreductase [unclassified Arthrobacter]MCQ9164752.1 NAD(P)-dependent oxidoreductase [Arthrobacter sp. STN4]NVM98800.1 NAD(P)-dependent oxidoreductase [Arthrobacter sp. SDTb3-6]